ncbi:hypothetical protein [Acaryochloris marina]|uniref:Uncharacterized protein n=1 Tax=Acaryochloris marina (strain MBIC 11017) TaxID=329726 RepID=A8ZL55_ACAM1|nr:hypothetical protein [Acaryochloris marina]ABW31882.1 hypothetical protein AM1_B0159 [Acaryochloris marina MBIC11017]BDM82949.1 hypothetical protein AM10699_58100 [Acaryochloris marina MBIC10699]
MAVEARATWQQAFVATNTLTLGHNTWCGFLAYEVVCNGWDAFKPLAPDFPNYNYFSLT